MYKTNSHSILVKSDPEKAFLEMIRWGESNWWPKNSLSTFIRRTPGSEITVGTVYKQVLNLPFKPNWNSEITEIKEPRFLERAFLNGFLIGSEVLSLNDKDNGLLEVNYFLKYKVRGFFNSIIWILIFRWLHDKNIQLILRSLKNYLENKQ